MAKSQQTYNKSEKEKKRLKKQLEKKKKREERKNSESAGFDDMIAYVDENGNITDTPPDPTKKTVIDASSIELGAAKREDEEVITERTGMIEFFNDSKGYGFIKEQGTGEKFFVHVNGLIDDVIEGNKVVFELERGMKGMNAVKVKKV